MKNKLPFFVLFLLFSGQWAWSGEKRLDFFEAMQKVSKLNWDIKIADEKIYQSLNAVGEAKSSFLPQLSASVSQFRQTRDLSGSGINIPGPTLVGPFNSFDARLKLSQMLFDVGMFERLQTLHVQTDLAKSFSKKNKEDILALSAGLFVDAYRAQENVKAQRAIFMVHKKQLKIALRKLTIGMATSSEWRLVKSQFTMAVHALVQSIAWRNKKLTDLKVVVNLNIQDNFILKLDKRMQSTPVLRILNNEHFNVLFAHQELEKAKRIKAMEQAQYFPKVDFMANWGPSGIGPNDFSETYALGVLASVPIFEGGSRQAKIKQAQSEIQTREFNLKKVSAQTQGNILKAQEAIHAAVAAMRNSEDVEQWAWQQLKEAATLEAIGSLSPVVFLEKQAQWVKMEDQKNDTVAGYLLAQINYAHALGRLSDFVLMNKEERYHEKR